MSDARDTETDTEILAADHVRSGDRLKARREELGYTLADIKNAIGVNVEYLSAMESMYAADVPSGYLSAYLRTYAKYLGLDAERIVSQFNSECGLVSDTEQKKLEQLTKVRREDTYRSLIAGGAAASGLVAAVALVVFLVSAGPSDPVIDGVPIENGARDSLFTVAEQSDLEPQFPLSLVALETAWLEARAEDGTIFRSREMAKGETYYPRIGAGWTVSARNGAAFEWRVGDVPVGLLSETSASVYAVSVDTVAADAKEKTRPALVSSGGDSAVSQ